MRIVYKMPVLKQVEKLIRANLDHDPEISHVEMSQADFTKLCRELRQKHGSTEPRDTRSTVIILGVHVKRVSQ